MDLGYDPANDDEFDDDFFEDAVTSKPEDGLSPSTIRSHESIWQRFKKFIEEQVASGNQDLLPGKAASADAFLAKGAAAMDFRTLTTFMLTTINKSTGRISRRMSVRSAKQILAHFAQSFKRRSDKPIDPKVLEDSIEYIDTVLAPLFHLVEERRMKTWTGKETMEKLVDTLFSPELEFVQNSVRPCIALLISILMQTGQRIGSLLPDHATDPTTTYRFFSIVVLPGTATKNVVVVHLRNPFGKTADARNQRRPLKRTDERWSDPVWWFFVCARAASALDPGVTLERLEDPAYLAGRSRVDLDCLPSSFDKPVFVGARTLKVHEKKGKAKQVKDGNVGTEVSMIKAMFNKWLGKLGRAAGLSMVMTTYVIRRSQAIWILGEGGSIEDVQVMLNHLIGSLVTREYIKEFLMDTSDLVMNPDGTIDRKALMERLRHTINYIRDDGQVKADPFRFSAARRGRILANPNVITAREKLDVLTEKVQQGEGTTRMLELQKVAWQGWVDALETARNAEIVDMFPAGHDRVSVLQGLPTGIPVDGAGVRYNANLVEEFLSTNDMQPEDLLILLEEAEKAKVNRRYPSMASAADPNIDPTLQSASYPPAPHIDNIQTFTLNPSTFAQNRTDPLDQAWRAVFHGSSLTDDQAISRVNHVPSMEKMNMHWSPGLYPVNGQFCPGCKETMMAIQIARKDKPSTACPEGELDAYKAALHIFNCVGKALVAEKSPALLAKYPQSIEDPFNSTEDTINVHRLMTRTGKKLVRDGFIYCLECDPVVSLSSLPIIQSHFLGEHTIWLPSMFPKVPTDWNEVTARLEPWLDWESKLFLLDPLGIENAARANYQTRFVDVLSQRSFPYGRRPDIFYPDGCLLDDNLPYPSDLKYKDERRGRQLVRQPQCILCVHNPDLSYTLRMWSPMANPLGHSDTCLGIHLKSCIEHQLAITEYNDSTDPDREPLPDHFLFVGNDLACPDLICRRKPRIFADLLQFVQHLTAVHHFRFQRGERLERVEGSVQKIAEMTFADTAALMDRVQAGSRTAQAIRARKAKKKAKAKGSDEEEEETDEEEEEKTVKRKKR